MVLSINSKTDLLAALTYYKAVPHSVRKTEDGVTKQDFQYPCGRVKEHTISTKNMKNVLVPITDNDNVIMIIESIPRGVALRLPTQESQKMPDFEEVLKEIREYTGFVPTNNALKEVGEFYLSLEDVITEKISTTICYGFIASEILKEEECKNKLYVSIPLSIAEEMLEQEFISDATTYIALNKTINELRKKRKLNDFEKRRNY